MLYRTQHITMAYKFNEIRVYPRYKIKWNNFILRNNLMFTNDMYVYKNNITFSMELFPGVFAEEIDAASLLLYPIGKPKKFSSTISDEGSRNKYWPKFRTNYVSN